MGICGCIKQVSTSTLNVFVGWVEALRNPTLMALPLVLCLTSNENLVFVGWVEAFRNPTLMR